MSKHTRILLATAGIPAVAIAATAVLASAWSSRLPEVAAVHRTNGTPGNSASLDLFLRIALLISAGLAMAVSAVAVTAVRRGNAVPRPAVGLLVGFATIPASGTIGVLIGNLDVRDWHEATGSAGTTPATRPNPSTNSAAGRRWRSPCARAGSST